MTNAELRTREIRSLVVLLCITRRESMRVENQARLLSASAPRRVKLRDGIMFRKRRTERTHRENHADSDDRHDENAARALERSLVVGIRVTATSHVLVLPEPNADLSPR